MAANNAAGISNTAAGIYCAPMREGTAMSDCDRVLERLYERRDSGRHLQLLDFVDLGLSKSVIGECLQDLHSLGWAFALVHKSSRDNSGVDRIDAQITDEGKREFERRRPAE
jgi:hypothetical protein